MLSNNPELLKKGFRIFLTVISIPLIILAWLVGLVLIILIPWMIWASFSTGGFYQLEQINPEYPHPNKNVAFLMAKLNGSPVDEFHVKQCAPYMPNWDKAKECVSTRLHCQSMLPPPTNSYGWPNFNSKQYEKCFEDNKPPVGFYEIMHFSRGAFRALVVYGILKLMNEDSLSNFESKKWWKKPLQGWFERGDADIH